MEYMSNDTEKTIVAKRLALEKTIKEARFAWKQAHHELVELQQECQHENATLEPGLRLNFIYYCYSTCPDCGKTGTRYVPEHHIKMTNSWANKWKQPQDLIDIERALYISTRVDQKYWWGPVPNYEDVINKKVR